MDGITFGLLDAIWAYLGTVGGGFIIGAAATYLVMRRHLRRKLPGPERPDLEKRVALLEEELSASRALVEQLSDSRAIGPNQATKRVPTDAP
jgi:hypothetical protein